MSCGVGAGQVADQMFDEEQAMEQQRAAEEVTNEVFIKHSLATCWMSEGKLICQRFPFAIQPRLRTWCDCGLEVVVSGVGGNGLGCRRQWFWVSAAPALGFDGNGLACHFLVVVL